MNPEAERPDEQAQASVQEPAAGPSAASPKRSAASRPAPAAKAGPQRKAGVPVWRTGKPDAFLAAAVDTARTAIEGITAAADIGPHLAAKSEGDRLVTHLFESRLPGYSGWQWYAVLTRNSRSKVVTVDELGLLPSEDSILAPEWVPWAERVRPEDAQQEDAQEQDAPGQEPESGDGSEGSPASEAGAGDQEPAGPGTGEEPGTEPDGQDQAEAGRADSPADGKS